MEIIDDNLIRILSESKVRGNNLDIEEQLSPKVYKEIKDLLLRVGGKWNGKTHVFQEDPTYLIAALIENKQWPDKNPHAFFPTPKKIVDYMLEMVIGEEIDVLEPSAGCGAIAEAIRSKFSMATIQLCEINKLHVNILRRKGFSDIYEGDFLKFKTDKKYNYVVMNPPFSYDGHPNAWIEHVLHAFEFLNSNGNLICIAPNGWETKETQFIKDFKSFLNEHLYAYEKIDAGSFKESGTGIATVMLAISKAKQQPTDLELIISNDQKLYNMALQVIKRNMQEKDIKALSDAIFREGLKTNDYYRFSIDNLKTILYDMEKELQ